MSNLEKIAAVSLWSFSKVWAPHCNKCSFTILLCIRTRVMKYHAIDSWSQVYRVVMVGDQVFLQSLLWLKSAHKLCFALHWMFEIGLQFMLFCFSKNLFSGFSLYLWISCLICCFLFFWGVDLNYPLKIWLQF